MNLPANAFSIKPGGEIQSLQIQGSVETFGNGVTSLEISGKIFQIMINQGIKAHGNKSSGIYLHKGAEVSLKKLKVICPKGTKILIEDGVFLNDSLDSLKTSSRNYISKNL